MAKQSKAPASPAPAPITNVLYVLTEKGVALAGKTANTTQRPEKDVKYGFGWRAAGFADSNLRACSAAALAELGPFSEAEFLAAVKPFCRSATPAGRFKCFLKAEYITEIAE